MPGGRDGARRAVLHAEVNLFKKKRYSLAYSIFPSPFCVLACFVQRCQTVPPPPPETFAPAHTVPTLVRVGLAWAPHTELLLGRFEHRGHEPQPN